MINEKLYILEFAKLSPSKGTVQPYLRSTDPRTHT